MRHSDRSLSLEVISAFDQLKAVTTSDLLLYSGIGLALAGLLDWRISQLSPSRNEKYRKIQSFAIIISIALFNIVLIFPPVSSREYYGLQGSASLDSAFLGSSLFKFVNAGVRILAIIFSLFLLMLFVEFLYRTFRRV